MTCGKRLKAALTLLPLISITPPYLAEPVWAEEDPARVVYYRNTLQLTSIDQNGAYHANFQYTVNSNGQILSVYGAYNVSCDTDQVSSSAINNVSLSGSTAYVTLSVTLSDGKIHYPNFYFVG